MLTDQDNIISEDNYINERRFESITYFSVTVKNDK